MAVELRMPKLGMTMRKGIVAKWLKIEGESVAQGEPIAEVMTEKITIQVESPGTGILKKVLVPIKQEVPVGALLALIGAVGEEIPALEAEQQTTAPVAVASALDRAATVAVEQDGGMRASPAARRVAREHNVDLSQVKPSGRDGRINREDVLAYVAALQVEVKPEGAAINASTAAIRLAEERGIDLSKVATDLGERRRITTEDVEAYSNARPEEQVPPSRSTPLVGERKITADPLGRSLHISTYSTIFSEVDATELVRAREFLLPRSRAATRINVACTDLLIALIARALGEFPILNSTNEGDKVILHEDVNIAVPMYDGIVLVVPVIHQAQAKSLGEISKAMSDLVRKVSEGRLSYEDIQGGTFTIYRPGMGGDISTPIPHTPQNAILSVGRVVEKPAVYRGEICIRQTFWLSLTFDPRAMNNAPPARFLDTLGAMIQEPMEFLGNV